MKPFILLLLALSVSSCASSAGRSCNVDPAIFCKPFQELGSSMSPAVKQKLLALPKSEYAQMHMGLGLDVRNRFGLWEDNDLTRFFRKHGVDHPDYMSMPFISGFVDYLRGEPVNMLKEIKLWGPQAPPLPPPPPSSAVAQPSSSLITHSSGRATRAAKFKR
jgi:hypothetical protein